MLENLLLFTPLTFDKEAINQMVNNITDTINQDIPWLSWTTIWDATLLAIDNLKKWSSDIKRDKVIILVTDWDANLWTNPKIAIKLAKSENIKIYSVGIWSKEWIPLYITDVNWQKTYFPDPNGQPLIVKLNETLLKKIADDTNWYYFNAKDTNSLKEIFNKLQNLNQTEIKTKSVSYDIPYYEKFVTILVLFLFCYFISCFLQKNYD